MKIKHWALTLAGAALVSYGVSWGINFLDGYYDIFPHPFETPAIRNYETSNQEHYRLVELEKVSSRPSKEGIVLEEVVRRRER